MKYKMKKLSCYVGKLYTGYSGCVNVLILLLAFTRSIAMHYALYGTEKALPAGLTAAVLLARTLLYDLLIRCIMKPLIAFTEGKISIFRTDVQNRHSGTRQWMMNCAGFAAVWLPFLLIKYPGAFCYDTWRMLHEYRIGEITGQHSVIYTLLLGGLVNMFEKTGHANWGLFLFTAIHYLLYVIVFGYALTLIGRMGVKKGVQRLIALLWGSSPYIAGYIGVVIKDAMYTAFLVLLTLILIDSFLNLSAIGIKKRVFFAAAIIGTCLTRKNGKYVVFLVLVCLLLYVLCRDRRYKRLLLTGILALLVAMGIDTGLNRVFDVVPGSVAEMLSVPFQQTARVVRDHGEKLTKEEVRVIDDVLVYDTLAERYNPAIADPVKARYRGDPQKLGLYFRLWLRQAFKYPESYIGAIMEQNQYLFLPELEYSNIAFYWNTTADGREAETSPYYEVLFHQPSFLADLNNWITSVLKLLHHNPIAGSFCNLSWNFYFFLFCIFLILSNADVLELLPFVPGLGTIVFVLIGPVIQYHPRYMFPVIYCMPVLFVYTLWRLSGKGIGGGRRTPWNAMGTVLLVSCDSRRQPFVSLLSEAGDRELCLLFLRDQNATICPICNVLDT